MIRLVAAYGLILVGGAVTDNRLTVVCFGLALALAVWVARSPQK